MNENNFSFLNTFCVSISLVNVVTFKNILYKNLLYALSVKKEERKMNLIFSTQKMLNNIIQFLRLVCLQQSIIFSVKSYEKSKFRKKGENQLKTIGNFNEN